MTIDNHSPNMTSTHSLAFRDSDIYKSNLEFWDTAWGGCKTAYKELPDLPYLASIPAWLHERDYRTILDLGCGSGWLSIFLAKQGFEVTGIDVAEHAVQLAKDWSAEENLSIKFDVGDISELPYRPGSFDAIVANSIFEHLTYDLAKHTIEKLKTLLTPGGGFVGCFDKVGTGPGEYFELDDGSHIYTDKFRKGMLLRYFPDEELEKLFAGWTITKLESYGIGNRFVCARI